jgi:hypothetical protein
LIARQHDHRPVLPAKCRYAHVGGIRSGAALCPPAIHLLVRQEQLLWARQGDRVILRDRAALRQNGKEAGQSDGK